MKSKVGSCDQRSLATNASFQTVRPLVRLRTSAFTLVELMLVLAVIGVLAAVAWPSVLRLQADHELSSAAEQARLLLSQARTQSIQTGLAYQVRYEPNGRYICVLPFEAELSQGDAGANSGNPIVTSAPRFTGELPKTISFAPASMGTTITSGTGMAQKLPESAFQGLPDATALAAVEWSPPLPFLSEGTSQDTLLTLADRRGHRIDLQIRGLTAATSVGPMRQEAVR